MFAARQLRLRVLEALELRVKQFLRRDELWPLRVPREPLLFDAVLRQALADEARSFDPRVAARADAAVVRMGGRELVAGLGWRAPVRAEDLLRLGRARKPRAGVGRAKRRGRQRPRLPRAVRRVGGPSFRHRDGRRRAAIGALAVSARPARRVSS